jgi:hypothetical protein
MGFPDPQTIAFADSKPVRLGAGPVNVTDATAGDARTSKPALGACPVHVMDATAGDV